MRINLREELVKIGHISSSAAESCNDKQTAQHLNDIITTVNSSLAEPIRNCDRFSNSKEAYDEFRNVCHKTSCKECRYRDYKTTCFVLWLFDDWAGDEALK